MGSILPGITVKTYSRREEVKCKGSRFYREFRNSCRQTGRALNQRDIRLWAKKPLDKHPEEHKATPDEEECRNQKTPEKEPFMRKADDKKRLKSVVYKLNKDGETNMS